MEKNITINMVHHIYGEEYAPKMRAEGLWARKVKIDTMIFIDKCYYNENWQAVFL